MRPKFLRFAHSKVCCTTMSIDPQASQILGNIGLAGAALYAARYLAMKLEQSQADLTQTLKTTIEQNATLLTQVRDAMSKCKGPMLVIWFLLVAGVACTAGCASAVVTAPNGASISARVPAWPWQDSSQVVSRAAIRISATNTVASLSGLDQSQVTNTNTLQFLAGVVNAAISAASSLK